MTKKAFTEEGVRRLRPPSERRLEIGDVVIPGLELRVTSRGVKSWAVLYRVLGEGGITCAGLPKKGRQKRLTIGLYPVFSLKAARERAREILLDATEGRDPAKVHRASIATRQVKTIEWAITEFSKIAGTKTALTRKRQLEIHVLPRWRNRPLSDLKRSDVHDLLDTLKAEATVDTAHRARKHLHAFFAWAVDREHVSANPVAGMSRDDLGYKPRQRILDQDEVRLVWRACDELGYPFGPLCRVLMLTAARMMEVAGAKRSWLSIKAGKPLLTVPADLQKSRREHVIPLSSQAAAILGELPDWGPSSYLFSTNGGDSPVSGFTSAKERLDRVTLRLVRSVNAEADNIPHWTPHDFRRVVHSGLGELSVPIDVRERVLGHAVEGLRRTYDKYDYLDEKREALEKWSNQLSLVLKHQNSPVL